MQITGTQVIPAQGQVVWDALNNPDVLKSCLPGCESVVREDQDTYKIVMTASVGPLRARFNGVLRITDAQPPSGCVMVFEGQGGAMGFGKGTSTVRLQDVGGGTELVYTAQAQVGGKLAQVGSRLIDSVARKMSDDFFTAFRQQVQSGEAPVPAPVAAAAASPAVDDAAHPQGSPASAPKPQAMAKEASAVAGIPPSWAWLSGGAGLLIGLLGARLLGA